MTNFYMPMVWKAVSHEKTIGSVVGYDTHEPYAVHLQFIDEFKTEWYMSRELLQQGLDSTAGEGDVLCWSSDDRYFLILRNPESSLLLSTSLGSMEYFLDYTNMMVPPGNEMIDIDSLVERLLQ